MEKNNTNKYIVIGVVVVVLALVSIPLMKKFRAEPVVNSETDNSQRVGTIDADPFSGTISAVDTGCFADAVCSVTVDGKKIILVSGGRGLSPDTTVGRLIGVDSIGDLEGRMGAFANVYAGLTPEGDYTLYGNSEYYVEVVMTSNK